MINRDRVARGRVAHVLVAVPTLSVICYLTGVAYTYAVWHIMQESMMYRMCLDVGLGPCRQDHPLCHLAHRIVTSRRTRRLDNGAPHNPSAAHPVVVAHHVPR